MLNSDKLDKIDCIGNFTMLANSHLYVYERNDKIKTKRNNYVKKASKKILFETELTDERL